MGRPVAKYAVYKGDHLICLGTIKECAEKIGISVATARFYTSMVHMERAEARKRKKNYTTITRIDDEG